MSYLESVLVFANDKSEYERNPMIFTIDKIYE